MNITKQTLETLIREELESLQTEEPGLLEYQYDENLLQENPAVVAKLLTMLPRAMTVLPKALAVLKRPEVLNGILSAVQLVPTLIDMLQQAGIEDPKLETYGGHAQNAIKLLEPVIGAVGAGDNKEGDK